MTAVTFEVVTSELSFAALAGSWNDLVRAMPRPSPFLLHGWLLEWWRHFGRGSELAVHVAFRDRELVAALPLFVRSMHGLRVGEFLGSDESALADLLLAAGEDPSIGSELAERVRASRLDLVDLFGLPERSRLALALRSELRLVERVEAPTLNTTSGWDAVYRARTSSGRRKLHRRSKRQLAALGRLEISVARTPQELESALEDAFHLHTLRWRGRPDHSSFGTRDGAAFHRAALAALRTDDVARIITLRLDGRPIAFDYYFVLCKRMYFHRLAFDPALARYSPGLICTLAALEAACAEGVERVEFLGGSERYKLDLADSREPLYQCLGLASSPYAQAFVAARLVSIRMRLRLKRSGVFVRLYNHWLGRARLVAVPLLHRSEVPGARRSSGARGPKD